MMNFYKKIYSTYRAVRIYQCIIIYILRSSNGVDGNILTSLFSIRNWNWITATNNPNNNTNTTNSTTEDTDDGYNNENYLYHIKNAVPVIDYEPPTDEKNILHPTFIYGIDADHPPQIPRVVEFYAPWCPHCQHFRNHYIELARQVQDMVNETIPNSTKHIELPQFYAVSCAVHRPLCHKFDVHGYPRIKVFPAGTTNYTAEIPYWKVHPFDILAELNIEIDQLQLETYSANNNTSNNIESNNDVNNKKSNLKANNKKDGYNDNDIIEAWPSRTKTEVFDDAYLSFDFNMRNAIYTSEGPLSNKTQQAFKNWLELLQKSLPVGWSQIQTVIRNVLHNFDYVVMDETNLITILDRASTSNNNKRNKRSKWSYACTKGVPGMGYTCGLWQLFHIMTVGIVEYNSIIESDDDSVLYGMQLSTTHAAETLRNFIEHFFGCIECKHNFLKEYDGCIHDHCTRFDDSDFSYDQWIQFPVWLWETHNTVNERLLHEAMLRENQKKQQVQASSSSRLIQQNESIYVTSDGITSRIWPLKHSCPKCWTKTGEHNEENVYKFLRTEYWPEDETNIEYRKSLSDEERKNTDDERTRQGFFTIFFRIVQFFSFATAVGFSALFYIRSSEKRRTGRHKKVDC